MRKNTIVIIFLFFTVFDAFASDCVILLHGLARSDASMSTMEKALKVEGYDVVNMDYPSREKEVESLAEEVIPQALKQCSNDGSINFVTHSMGGILVRQYLSKHTITELKHVVMLGPPNKGSEVVDKLQNVPGFSAINGPAGLQLGTGQFSLPNTLGPAEFSLGVIAGTRSINLILSAIIPDADDGKVSVENTKLEGMKEHIALPVSHPFLMKNKDVISQVIYFLKNGEFENN